MDRRKPIPQQHPLVRGFTCPTCGCERVRLGTVVDFYFYLLCDECAHVWAHPERRRILGRPSSPHNTREL
jgi:transcription elongation factor Elf1